MQISISKSLAGPFVVSSPADGAGQDPVFTQSPALTPASGVAGTVFTLTYGGVSPQSAALSAVLTLNGADVTQAIDLSPQGMTYTAPAEGPAGDLVWQVRATTPTGTVLAAPATATVTPAAATNTEITMGSVIFTFDGSYQTGLDAGGKAYVVVPSGSVTVLSVTPAQTQFQGAAVHGLMKNPQRTPQNSPDQGYDGRFSTYDPALNTALPVSLSAGDVLVKTVGRLPHENRKGAFDEIAALHVVSEAPPAGAYLGASVQWAGQSTPEWYSADIDGFYAARTPLSSTGLEFPPFEVLMQSIDQFYPLFAQLSSANANIMGYENASPYGFGGGLGNYGRYVSSTIETAMLALASDVYSEPQTKALLRRVVQHGIEWGNPMLYGPEMYSNGPDGGHFQFHQGPVAVALAVTGRADQLPLLMQNAPGNWGQAFKIDAAVLADMADPNGSYVTRHRTLGPQPGGAAVRLVYGNHFNGPDWYQTKVPAGARIERVSDGVSVLVPTDTALASSNPSPGYVDVPTEGVSPFVQGDVVRITFPEGWVAEGLYDWTLRGVVRPHMYSPTAANEYRDLQNWGSLMALKALDLVVPNMEAVEGYMARAAAPDTPAPYNDYPAPFGSYKAFDGLDYTVSQPFYNRHWASLEAASGNLGGDYTPDDNVTITFETALTPQAQATSMVDGIVIGLVPGETLAPVRLRGTASGVDQIEVRIRRQSGGIVQDWTPVAIAENGVWDGVLSLPRADGWWAADARPVHNPTAVQTISEKFAVGYKFMWLGQSQMTMASEEDGAIAPLTARASGTASYYRWQRHNANGYYSEGEVLYIVDANNDGSDAVRAFIDQFRAFDPDTPIQIMRASVSGTGILDMLDDGNDRQRWSDLTDKTDKYGGDVSVVIENWYTSNTSALDGHQDLDLLNGINSHGFDLDHALPDVLQPGYIYAVQPATRHSKAHNDVVHAASKIDRANVLGWPVGFAMSDFETEDFGGPHAITAGPGNLFLGARMALLAADALGYDAPEQPHFPTTGTRSADGTVVTFTPVLPNGGTLYSPAPEDLRLFMVDYGTGLTTEGFTARIADNGTDVELIRTGGQTFPPANFIKVQAFANGPLNDDQSASGQTLAEWRALEQAIINGQLYESFGPDVTGRGLPVAGIAPDGVWRLTDLDEPVVSVVTQEAAASVQSALPIITEHKEADATIAPVPRERTVPAVLYEGDVPPADGSTYLIGALQITGRQYDGALFDTFEVQTALGGPIGQTQEIAQITLQTAPPVNSGWHVGIQAYVHTDNGAGRSLYARTNRRKLMSYLPVYRIDGFTTQGAVTATSTDGVVQLSNVVPGSAIIVFAQKRGGTGITWTGVVEDGSYSLNYDGIDNYQAAASGIATAGGDIWVGAGETDTMVVVVLPPS